MAQQSKFFTARRLTKASNLFGPTIGLYHRGRQVASISFDKTDKNWLVLFVGKPLCESLATFEDADAFAWRNFA